MVNLEFPIIQSHSSRRGWAQDVISSCARPAIGVPCSRHGMAFLGVPGVPDLAQSGLVSSQAHQPAGRIYYAGRLAGILLRTTKYNFVGSALTVIRPTYLIHQISRACHSHNVAPDPDLDAC